MLLTKENLTGQYQWATSYKNVLFTGSPSRRVFDRWNGFQVLFLINCFALLSDNFSIEEGKAVENLIIDGLPLNKQSELSAFAWLRLRASRIYPPLLQPQNQQHHLQKKA